MPKKENNIFLLPKTFKEAMAVILVPLPLSY